MADASADRSTPDGSTPASATAPASTMAALVAAHHEAVYRYARRLCGSDNDAEDVTQQTFLIAQRKLHQLREPERSRSWLLAVARSCFLKSIRKPRPVSAQDIELTIDDVADVTPKLDQIDHEKLTAALHELPEEFRLVVLMFYYEDLSYQQIAEQLGLAIGTVMSRLSRAKARLRQRLQPALPVQIQPALPPPTIRTAIFQKAPLG